jgi:hypothetical protein
MDRFKTNIVLCFKSRGWTFDILGDMSRPRSSLLNQSDVRPRLSWPPRADLSSPGDINHDDFASGTGNFFHSVTGSPRPGPGLPRRGHRSASESAGPGPNQGRKLERHHRARPFGARPGPAGPSGPDPADRRGSRLSSAVRDSAQRDSEREAAGRPHRSLSDPGLSFTGKLHLASSVFLGRPSLT